MEQLINSYNIMVSVLMSREKTDFELLKQAIKIFLTTCDKFAKETAGAFWKKKANFYCLLNLIDQIKEFGPVRDWYIL